MKLHHAPTDEVPSRVLYDILRLRAAVFVLEQECIFVDPDGRDFDPGVVQVWAETDAGEVVGCARLLPMDGGGTHIGRVVTSTAHRSTGLGKQLMVECLRVAPAPYELKAQSRLCGWYAQFGFVASGEEFEDDGILHTPMWLDGQNARIES